MTTQRENAMGETLAQSEIVQLVPAGPGWHAQYQDGPSTILHAVAMWAIVETPESARRIVGIAPDDRGTLSCHAEEAKNFQRYVYVAPGTTQLPAARTV
jgi:hypothetical protein